MRSRKREEIKCTYTNVILIVYYNQNINSVVKITSSPANQFNLFSRDKYFIRNEQ